MNETLGRRIAGLRKEKGMTQEELAEVLSVSPQAVSKWENDQSCPDISLLPALAEILGITVDTLLQGEKKPEVQMLPVEQRKDIKDMMFRVVVDSANGDKVRVNLPMMLVQVAMEMGLDISQVSGNDALKNLDLKKIMELVGQGIVGDLVEVESAGGDIVHIFVE